MYLLSVVNDPYTFCHIRDKLEVTITVNVQYFLNKDDLAELHQEYDIFYKDVFKQTAKDVVKVRRRKNVEVGELIMRH